MNSLIFKARVLVLAFREAISSINDMDPGDATAIQRLTGVSASGVVEQLEQALKVARKEDEAYRSRALDVPHVSDPTGEVCVVLDDSAVKLEAMERDMAAAAGELAIELPEPGTCAAQLLSANVILRGRVAEMADKLSILIRHPTDPAALSTRDAMRTEMLIESMKDNDAMRDILREIYDGSPCSLDRHGSCQEHNSFGEGECRDKRIGKLLGIA